MPCLTWHLTEQPADGQPAVDGNAGHGAVLLHREGIDAASAEASGLRDVCWDPRCIVVYAGGEGKQDEAGETEMGGSGGLGTGQNGVLPPIALPSSCRSPMTLEPQCLLAQSHLTCP